jgi:hypothetical protein
LILGIGFAPMLIFLPVITPYADKAFKNNSDGQDRIQDPLNNGLVRQLIEQEWGQLGGTGLVTAIASGYIVDSTANLSAIK